MRIINTCSYFILLILVLSACKQSELPHSARVMIVTGGHEFESSFYRIFDSYQKVAYDTMTQPAFNQHISSDKLEKYDALVFYDMWQEISEAEKSAYIKLLEQGQGMIFLHHSLVSYQHWDEFQKIIGGKYIELEFYDNPPLWGSTYHEDITLDIKVINKDHPVTRDIPDFSIFDEGYQNIDVLPDIEPLLSTSHPDCTPVVAWAHHYKRSKIVYILLGHGRQAHENEYFRKIIRNAIRWVDQ